MGKGVDTRQNLVTAVENRMNKLFAIVLSAIEDGEDVKIIRKKLLDEGNGILSLLRLVMTRIEITPIEAVVELKNDVHSKNKSDRP